MVGVQKLADIVMRIDIRMDSLAKKGGKKEGFANGFVTMDVKLVDSIIMASKFICIYRKFGILFR